MLEKFSTIWPRLLPVNIMKFC